MKEKSYSRRAIPPEISIPWGELKLVYSNHALSRMDARTKGSLSILPTMIVLSEKNLKQVWTVESGGKEGLRSILVDVPYTRGTLLQLVISADGVVITLYFRDTKWQRTNAKRVETHLSESTASDTSNEVLSSEEDLLIDPPKLSQPKAIWHRTAS